MNHSQIRNKSEHIKIFAHKRASDSQPNILTIQEFAVPNQNIVVDITPTYTVQELNTGYYSTEFTAPDYDCYLIITFIGSPMVVRVGNPRLQFITHTKEGIVVPYEHFNEFGQSVSIGDLIELNKGFYYYTPIESDLGYIEVFGRPNVLNIPFYTGVVDIDWAKNVKSFSFKVKQKRLNFMTIPQNKLKFGVRTKTLPLVVNKLTNKSIKINIHKIVFRIKCKEKE